MPSRWQVVPVITTGESELPTLRDTTAEKKNRSALSALLGNRPFFSVSNIIAGYTNRFLYTNHGTTVLCTMIQK